MTEAEFRQWYHHAANAYPTIIDWMARSPEADATYALWHQTLHDCQLDHAKRAIDAMFAGTLPRPEYGWSDMPKIVRQFCRGIVDQQLKDKQTQARREERNRDRWRPDDPADTCVAIFERLEREKWGGPPEWCARYSGRKPRNITGDEE